MLVYTPLVGIVAVAALSLSKMHTLLRTRSMDATNGRHPSATLLDPTSTDDALRLVTRLTTPETTIEQLSDALVELFVRFPPSERSLRAMSLHQQALVGSGGRHEYAVCTVYASMMQSVAGAAAGAAARSSARASARASDSAPPPLLRRRSA